MRQEAEAEEIRNQMRTFKKEVQTCCSEKSLPLPEIIAVTKKQPEWKIKIALEEGFTKLGENYVQEARKKQTTLQKAEELHLLGPLQSGNINRALRIFDFIQSIHSEKILLELEKRARKQEKTIPILLEIKTSHEPTKAGFLPEEAIRLSKKIQQEEINLNNAKILGVMTIAPLGTLEEARLAFRTCKKVGDIITENLGIKNPVYSYGMSADYKIAIEEGSNMIRVGTRLFGPRV